MLCMCSMFGVDVVYMFHVCVPCMCSMYVFHVCVYHFGVDVVYVFYVWCRCCVCVPCLLLMLRMCFMFGVDVVLSTFAAFFSSVLF